MAAEGAPSFVCLPELASAGGRLAIGGEEARYLARVVRVRPGERVSATDGRGAVATLEVLACGPEVETRVLALEHRARAATLEFWCGAPEGDRADWLVEKLGELGVATLVPLQCARGTWERADAKRDRWERLATAALRQSRSPWRMAIAEPRPLSQALEALAPGAAGWVARPDGATAAGVVGPVARAVAVVGPSSGFEAEELKRLSERGFAGVSLAPTRLRTETAALAMAALWAAVLPAGAPAWETGPGRA